MASPSYYLGHQTNDNPIQPNELVLTTINDGIRDILMRIKNGLGNEKQLQDTNINEIMVILEGIESTIKSSISKLNTNKTQTNDLTFDADINGELITQYKKTDEIGKILEITDESRRNNIINELNMTNLDDEKKVSNPAYLSSIPSNLSPTPEQIQARLDNCQKLEMLYLIKHDELMTTFAFTINLFHKYKYATNMSLYILKNLTLKQAPPPGTIGRDGVISVVPGTSGTDTFGKNTTTPGTNCNVQLPGVVIERLTSLLEDQKTVQGVIDSMKAEVAKVDKDTRTKFETVLPETNLRTLNYNANKLVSSAVSSAANKAAVLTQLSSRNIGSASGGTSGVGLPGLSNLQASPVNVSGSGSVP
jgi:hypothetical protein